MMMVHCRGCGQPIHETAPTCPHCGAPQGIASTGTEPIPEGVKGWSWGAFFFNWLWGIFNGTWIALFALIPYAGFIMAVILGFKGREWAWKNKRWDNLEHFNRVQRAWSIWAGALLGITFLVGILAAVALPAYQDYQKRAAIRRSAESVTTPRAIEAPQEPGADDRTPAVASSAGPVVATNVETPSVQVPSTEAIQQTTVAVETTCATNLDCIASMLNASNPRDPRALNAISERLLGLPGPVAGDRKTSRDLNTKGLANFSQGNFPEAVALFEQAVVADPHDVEIRSNLGLAFVKTGRSREAIDQLAVALQIAPRRSMAWAPLAEALDLASKPDQAYEALLLTYEFSGNKDKTKDFFQSRVDAADITPTMRAAYTTALNTIQSGY